MDLPHLIGIKNGDKVQGAFSAGEMTARLSRLLGSMSENGIDFALFNSYQNINWEVRRDSAPWTGKCEESQIPVRTGPGRTSPRDRGGYLVAHPAATLRRL